MVTAYMWRTPHQLRRYRLDSFSSRRSLEDTPPLFPATFAGGYGIRPYAGTGDGANLRTYFRRHTLLFIVSFLTSKHLSSHL